MNSPPSLSRSGSRLQDHRVLSFDQSVRDEFLKKRQECRDVPLRVDEFDAQRHVLGRVRAPLLRMDAMMGPESGFGTQHGCARHALFEE